MTEEVADIASSAEQRWIEHRHRVMLLLILSLAAVLRLWDLTGVPNGFHADEASIGYDAYSMLETGRDQYGEFLPLFSRSFGDYDESLYRYLTIPFVAVLGLTEFSTRLPASLAGILTVWVFFSLVRDRFGVRVALVAALFLAISPWHIQFSRWAVRAILLPLFFSWGLAYFYRGLQRPRLLVLSAFLFGISLHTYNSARVFVPLFLAGGALLHWRELWTLRRRLVLPCVVFLCIFVPLFSFWISPEGLTRARSTLTTDVLEVVENYLSYLSPGYLFSRGDANLRHGILRMGQLHYVELLTVIAGMVGMVRSRKREDGVWWLWLVLYPIPAALTEPTHAIRSIMGAPLFALLSGYGLVYLGELIHKPLFARMYRIASLVVLVASAAWFSKLYFTQYPGYGAIWWQHGMKETISFAQQSRVKCVIFSDSPHFFPAYIFVVFYTRYSPHTYQTLDRSARENLWMYTRPNLDKYFSLNISDLELNKGTCLVVARPDELEEIRKKEVTMELVREISAPNSEALISLVQITGGGR